MTDFHIKQNDTSPALEAQLTDDDGSGIDLAAADVQFHLVSRDRSETAVDDTATIVDSTDGVVKYEWSASDTDSSGRFLAEFEVTYDDGTIESFPNSRNITVEIVPELG